jgi:hypothetical protein
VVSTLCSAAALGAYHVLLAPTPRVTTVLGPDADLEAAVSRLRREVASLRDELGMRPTPSEASPGEEAAAEAGALAARVQALEMRFVGGDPNARRLPSGVGDKPSAWTEQQIQDFRGMLEAVERRRVVEQETKSFQQMLANVDPNMAPATLAAATSLLTEFMRSVRGTFSDPAIRDTPENYVATMEKAKELRGKLGADLRQLLKEETVAKVLERLPTFDTSDLRSPAARDFNDAAMDGGAMDGR